MKLQCSTEYLSDRASDSLGFHRSPRALGGFPLDYRVFTQSGSSRTRKYDQISSLELPPSYRVRHSASGRRLRLRPKSRSEPSAPPVRFFPLQRFPIWSSGTNKWSSFPRSAGLRLQVFSTSWRIHPPQTYWPCLMPDPPLGFALQSIAPPVQPHAVSGAVALLSLECRFDSSEPTTVVTSAEALRRTAAVPCGRTVQTPLAYRALLHTKVRHFVAAV
jgi:hypothetical protein